jgi:hypothetical protein
MTSVAAAATVCVSALTRRATPHTGNAGVRLAAWTALRRHAWLAAVLGIALLIGELPHLLSACCAPPGATGLGTAWFVNDFAQYESAMRQGAEQPGWLVHDPFTAEPHQPAFMFPLYVGMGKLTAMLDLPAQVVEHGVEIVARALLVLALWRFCRGFTADRTAARWALGLSLFASGFELLAALAGGAVYTGNWSYEMNGFGLLFAAPHVPLGMAATLELARELLRPGRSISLGWLSKVGLLSTAVALLHPFHAPVLLGAVMLVGVAFWRTGRGVANLAGGLVAGVAALPVLLPTIVTFSLDPFWGSTYSVQNQLPSPAPHELLVDLGPTLVPALVGAAMLRARVAPFGLLVWLLLQLVAMYLPVPYQRRLGFGSQPVLAVLAANGLVHICAKLDLRRAAALRLGVVGTAASGTLLVLMGVLTSGLTNAPLPLYRSTSDLDAAAAWLDAQAQPDDVIVADWQASNYLAARTPARVFGGHPVATREPDRKRLGISAVFAHSGSLAVARGLGAQWLVYGPEQAGLTVAASPEFQSGAVRVYRLT